MSLSRTPISSSCAPSLKTNLGTAPEGLPSNHQPKQYSGVALFQEKNIPFCMTKWLRFLLNNGFGWPFGFSLKPAKQGGCPFGLSQNQLKSGGPLKKTSRRRGFQAEGWKSCEVCLQNPTGESQIHMQKGVPEKQVPLKRLRGLVFGLCRSSPLVP